MATTPPVFFVRHGETDWNAEGRLQGQADTDINATGRAQADRNGARLGDLIATPGEFDFVASPLRRTRETMERVRRALGLNPMTYRVDPILVEVHFGDWQGFTFAELETNDPGCTAPRALDKWNFRPPGAAAESYAMLRERVRPWFEALSRPTVCVTHGGVVRVVLNLVGNVPESEAAALGIRQDRVLRYEGGRLDWL